MLQKSVCALSKINFHAISGHFMFLVIEFHKLLKTNRQFTLKMASYVYGSFICPN